MENPFENSAVIGLSNGEIKNNIMQQKVIKKAHLALFVEKQCVLKCILLASKPLIIMQLPHNFNKHVMVK